ncbi:MAG: Gfo/Idh/MocA family oxidoreductase [Bacteroidales bacterium]|nr:Gfo/Idh/MocA family oxidoreductase [Bacteroidales bacterium]
MKKENRREFIKKTSAAAAGISLGGLAASAKSYRRIMGANERLNVGIIGCMRRAEAIRSSFTDLKDQVEVSYVCDVVKDRRDQYAASLKEPLGYLPAAVNDFREILADSRVDAVFHLTPDHWHAPGSFLALEAGKHVYVEKPLTHNPREGELFLEFEKKFPQVIFMGTQQRSQSTARKVVKELQDGLIGDIYQVLAHYTNGRASIGKGKVMAPPEGFDWDLFQGPAPRQDYMDILFDYNWHWFWPWGTGETGNNATHEFDVARWILQVDHPEEVHCSAGKYYYREDDWSMYDTMDVRMKYPGGKTIRWDGRSRTGHSIYGEGRGNVAYGTEGTATISRNGYKIYDLHGKLVREEEEAAQSVTTGMGGGGDITTRHIHNFFQTVRGQAKPNSVLKEAAGSSHLNHLANIAYLTGGSLKVDPSSGHILDEEIMKKHWAREYEPGWEPVL